MCNWTCPQASDWRFDLEHAVADWRVCEGAQEERAEGAVPAQTGRMVRSFARLLLFYTQTVSQTVTLWPAISIVVSILRFSPQERPSAADWWANRRSQWHICVSGHGWGHAKNPGASRFTTERGCFTGRESLITRSVLHQEGEDFTDVLGQMVFFFHWTSQTFTWWLQHVSLKLASLDQLLVMSYCFSSSEFHISFLVYEHFWSCASGEHVVLAP